MQHTSFSARPPALSLVTRPLSGIFYLSHSSIAFRVAESGPKRHCTTSNDHYEQLEPHPVDDPYLCLGDVVRSLACSLLDLRRHHQQQQSSTQDAHAPYDCCPQQSRGWILTNRRSRACSYCLQTSTGTNDLSVEPKAPSTIDFGARRHGSTL